MLIFASVAYLTFSAGSPTDDPALWIGALAGCQTREIDRARADGKAPLSRKKANAAARRIVAACRQHVPAHLFSAKELKSMEAGDTLDIARKLRAWPR